MMSKKTRFEHSIETLEIRKLSLETLIDRCQRIRYEYPDDIKIWKEQIEDIDDALCKLRNHSLTEKM